MDPPSGFLSSRKPHAYRLLIVHIHVSGSAYKIVNNRAYHHGTMLISTRLDTLGDLLHTKKVGWCSGLWCADSRLGGTWRIVNTSARQLIMYFSIGNDAHERHCLCAFPGPESRAV